MFVRLREGVHGLGRWTSSESANIAAALYVDLRAKQPDMAARDIGPVIPGDPQAQVPSLFVTPRHGYHHHSGDPVALVFSAPIAMAQRPADDTLAPLRRQVTIDADGYLTDPGIVHTPIERISHGPMPQVNAIVLHRTESSTAGSTLATWRNRDAGTGAHFLIDRDGAIHQTVSVDRQAWHVGAIRSRGEVEGTIPDEDQRQLVAARNGQSEWRGPAVRAVSRIESSRPYPERYPTNADSIGIEVVGRYRPATQTWDAPTPEQAAAITRLMGVLQRNFALNDQDVYEHDVISRKTPGEGAGLYAPGVARDVDSPARDIGGVPVPGVER
ncbi:N-acetylmuramoyl-L-alanine amidase [Luteimonas kalidii]|uniref:N-acetylmuramoyl-L-alanine amidase n=1 Tax=Luteimonas kalidii TaxID=3042025 RepID=A0ABT6JSH0_9GAMM|nr:peptidoglycan recognition family protein [Luteimonas kalidii]MDH5833413.1 peptidoglycan recognition family protein [Luteimonas kalidii]